MNSGMYALLGEFRPFLIVMYSETLAPSVYSGVLVFFSDVEPLTCDSFIPGCYRILLPRDLSCSSWHVMG